MIQKRRGPFPCSPEGGRSSGGAAPGPHEKLPEHVKIAFDPSQAVPQFAASPNPIRTIGRADQEPALQGLLCKPTFFEDFERQRAERK